jgi:hypothetical protein
MCIYDFLNASINPTTEFCEPSPPIDIRRQVNGVNHLSHTAPKAQSGYYPRPCIMKMNNVRGELCNYLMQISPGDKINRTIYLPGVDRTIQIPHLNRELLVRPRQKCHGIIITQVLA